MKLMFADYPANFFTSLAIFALTLFFAGICLLAAFQMESAKRKRATVAWIVAAVVFIALGLVGCCLVKKLDLP